MRLYKRGRTWWCWYYDASGARAYASTRQHDRRAAENVARDLERSAVDPTYRAAHGATLTDAVAALVRQRVEDARAGARSMHTAIMHRVKGGHLIRLLGDVPLRMLTGAHGDEYVSRRRAEHAAPATIHKELTTWRAALKLARRRGVWEGDPAAVVPTISVEYTPRSRWLTPDDLDRLLGALSPDRAARVAWIVATSARWAESERALRLDVTREVARLRGTKTTRALRTVPLVAPWQRSLAEYAVRHATGAEGRLFAPWTSPVLVLRRACRDAGIAPCTPNDLRRTCGTWLRAGGCAPDIVAAVLGHADSRMVERVYGRLDVAQLAQRIASALGCSTGVTDSALAVDDAHSVDTDPARDHRISVPRVGIEPTTRGFSGPASGWRRPRNDSRTARVSRRGAVQVSQRVRGTEPRTRRVA